MQRAEVVNMVNEAVRDSVARLVDELMRDRVADMQPLAVPIAEAPRFCSIGISRLYDAVKDGRLPIIKNGRRSLVRVAALQELLASMEQQGCRRDGQPLHHAA
jgi:hypothetical protein